ncbi:MAG: hypothetical protein AAGI63_08230 [Planctomycetota bacterium]
MRLEYRNPQTVLTVHGESQPVQGLVPIPPPQPSAARWFRRFVGLSLLGGLIGAGIAAIAFFLQPPIYRSKVRVQLVDVAQLRGIGNARVGADYGTPLSDEVLVARSEQVLREAASTGRLAIAEPFLGLSSDEIAARLGNDRSLVIEPAFDDQATNVIRIQYDHGDPSTTELVVGAIADAYQVHTAKKFEQKDTQVMDQVLKARDDTLAELQRLEAEHDDFKMETDLVFVDGRPQSIHRQTADRYQTQKQELLVTKAEIEAQLNAAERSLERGDSASTVMLALRGENETASDVIEQNMSRQLQQLQNELRDRTSVRVQETELLPLQLEREDLLEKYGASHPSVRAIDQQIRVVENQITRLEAQEEEKEALIKQVMSISGQGTGDGELDPEAEVRKRVDLAIDALKQRLDSIRQQIDSVSEAYEFELVLAKEEVAAIRESNRFERDIARQEELYAKIIERLDDVKLSKGNESLNVTPLDQAQPGRRVTQPVLYWLGGGGMIGVLIGSLMAILITPRQQAPEIGQLTTLQASQIVGQVALVPSVEVVEPTEPTKLE